MDVLASLLAFSALLSIAGDSAERLEAPPGPERPAVDPDAEQALPGPEPFDSHPVFPASFRPVPVLQGAPATDPYSSHLAGRELLAAKDLLDRGDSAAALVALRKLAELAPAGRFLRLRALVVEGKGRLAAAEADRLVEDYPALADRIRFLAGESLAEEGDLAGAAKAYEAVPAGSTLRDRAQLALAKTKLKLSDSDGAVQVLLELSKLPGPLIGDDLGGLALDELVSVYQSRGDLEAFERAALQRYVEHPLSGGDDLPARLKAAGRRAPNDAELLRRAQLLLEAQRNRRVVALASPIAERHPVPDADGCRARLYAGKALRNQRAYGRAVAMLRPVVESCADGDMVARALYLLGVSSGSAQAEKAESYFQRIADEHPGSPLADDGLFMAADLHQADGEIDEALELYRRIGQQYPGGDYAAEALFRTFWIDRLRGVRAQALEDLSIIEEIFTGKDSYEVQRANYWRGRVMAEQGQPERALSIWRSLAAQFPASFYGLLARSRLREADLEAPLWATGQLQAPARLPKPSCALSAERHFQAGVELLRLGFGREAAEELAAVDRAALARQGAFSDLRLLAALLVRAGDPKTAHAIARRELKQDLEGAPEGDRLLTWQVAYPPAYRDLLERYGAAFQVDADMMQALMREESALEPRARSWAGAIGLCQLMVSTANAVARGLKLGRVTEASLIDPSLNIRLGTAFLGGLLRHYKGNPALALAAYNAGQGAVGRWLGEHGGGTLDEFIEEIPYEETRGYVKRVLRTYSAYRLLYAKKGDGAVLIQSVLQTAR